MSNTARYKSFKQFQPTQQRLAVEYHNIGKHNAANSLRQCSDVIMHSHCGEHEDQSKVRIQYCKNRFCPTCTVHRSHVLGQELRLVVDDLHDNGVRQENWIFLTLTIRNCEVNELAGEINNMMRSWQRFSQRKSFRTAVKGWFRAFELTYNKEEQTYHPHFHVLINTNASYFSGKYYISQKEWQRLWKESLNVDYDPIVDVRRVKSKTQQSSKGLVGAILEVCKYPMKVNDLSSILRQGDFQVYEEALFKRRIIAFGGNLKETLKVVRAKKDKSDGTCEVCGMTMQKDVYVWSTETQNYQSCS